MSKICIYGLVIQLSVYTFAFSFDSDAQTKSLKEIEISLHLESPVKLEKVFQFIERTTDFRFSHIDQEINTSAYLIELPVNKMTMEDLLLNISSQHNLSFRRVNDFIQVRMGDPFDESATQVEELLQLSVSGRVTDENGEPLPGATVLEQGTSNGSTTDIEGNFKLVCNENASLTISFVGYQTKVLAVNGRSVIDISLAPDFEQLEEVVVIGYGVQKKSDLTGSVSSLNKDDMNVGVNTSVDDLLQGKTAGVFITQASAEPGGGATVQIRGAGSINAGSSPLYIIDGLPIDLNQVINATGEGITNTRTPRNPLSNINPADIESIEVLKDASATAIYGARGANGVIIVTTKKGSSGKMNINYQGYTGIQSPSTKIDVLSAEDYMRVLNEILDDPGSNVAESERVTEIQNGGTDWQEELHRNARIQSHSISMNGGNDQTTYFASVNYFDQQGVVISSSYERYDARLNLAHKTDKFYTGFNFTTSYAHDDFLSFGYDTNEQGGALYAATAYDPTLSVVDANGNYTISDLINTDNPIALANGESSSANNYRTLGTIFGEYTILPGWNAKVNFGFDSRNSRRDSYVSTQTKVGNANGGIASILTGTRNNYLAEFTTSYVKDFNANHSISAVTGFTYQKFTNDTFSGTGKEYPNDESKTYAIGSGNPELNTLNSFKANNKLLSYIARVNYSLFDKYLFTATFRADGSSRFGANNKYGYFPSGAFAWKLHEEEFIQDLGIFTTLKLRTSIGLTGNQEIGNYRSVTTFATGGSVILGGQKLVTLAPQRIPNPDLKWETTEQINFGLDMGFLDDRIYASLDYYQRNTYDLLFELPIPNSSGFSSILTNIGQIRNSGFEFFLESRNLVGEFKWNTSLNFSALKNKVVDLGGISEVIHTSAGWTSQIAIIKEGEVLNSFYGWRTQGIWQSDQEITDSGTTDPVKPGDVRYEDINGDGTVNADDRVILGNSFPDFTFGITNTFSYKGFALNIFVDGVQGIDMLNNTIVETYFPISHRRNRLAEPYLNRWTESNPSNEYPSFVNPTNQGNKGVSTITVEDASYVRLRNIKLGYDIPLNSRKIFNSINVYVSGQNLFLLTDYSGTDPTTNSNGNASLKIDFNSYPVARTYMFGVDLSF